MPDADIRFELENPSMIFYPGQDIRGNVHVIVREQISPRKINVEFFGVIHASFSHGSGKNRRHYTATSRFIEELYHLWEPNRDGASDSLMPGEYRFPFSFRLHPNREYLPVFGGPYGHVSYKLVANIDLAWQFDPTAAVILRVVGLYNMGDPKFQNAVEGQDSKTICCLWCASAPITCKLRSPVGGAIPEDLIKPVITVNNPSDRPVLSASLSLRQRVIYRAQGSAQSTVNVFKLSEFPETIPPGTQSITLSKDAILPKNLVPSFAAHIITIDYELLAELVMPAFVLNLDTSVRFFIGNSRTAQVHTPTTPIVDAQPQGTGVQGYPPQGYPPQGYPPQGYPPQGYPPQGYPPQGYPVQEYQPQVQQDQMHH